MDLRTFFLLVLFLGVPGTLAAPTDSGKCAGECAPVYNPKFAYSIGKTYSYGYGGVTSLQLPGTTNDQPLFKISAIADITVITPCEFSLTLDNVLTVDQTKIKEAKAVLESKPLVFSFADGRIKHVCADPSDPAWSVNFKRGVLSTFQNTMDENLHTDVFETDVAGRCPTHYDVISSSGKSTRIRKVKELGKNCFDRVHHDISINDDAIRHHPGLRSSSVVNSTQTCTQVIENNIIESVECEEHHYVTPLSKNGNGINALSSTTLQFLKETKSASKGLVRKFERSTLLFDHSEEHDHRVSSDIQEALAAVKHICETVDDDVQPETAKDFTNLVFLVRRLSADNIRKILQQLESGLCPKPKTKDIFLSAINDAGTEGSVQVIVELLTNNRVPTPLRARYFLTSLAFVHHPTPATIEAVNPLIDSPNPDRVALLSVSALVHTFCDKHENCENEKAVQKLIDKLGRHLGYKCKANNPAEEDKVIATLKAFGNIGHSGKYSSVIQDCIKDSSLKVPVRLAAIQAFRRSSYNDDTRRVLTQILEDTTQDTEVRIASYLSLLHQPSHKTIQKIQWLLNIEPINQVSSFIYSHLKNLQESHSPLKSDIRQLVKNINLSKKIHSKEFKYSQNCHHEYFSEELGAGADVDLDTIFSPDSFLPRSLSANITLDVLGHSIDFLEVDVRAANFEHFLESYFGPAGTVTTNSEQQLKTKLTDRWRRIFTGIENEAATSVAHRHKREAPQKSRKYKQIIAKVGQKPVAKPEGSLSLKLFGNEIRWYDFHSLEEIYDREDPYYLKKIFNKLASHKEFDVARNVLFVDTTFTIPTISGFALHFNLNGSASVGLKLKSHFDVRQFLLKPRSLDIVSLILPSASVELSSAVLIDSGISKNGYKLSETYYTSTAIDGTLLLKDDQQIVAKIDFPKNNMDILNMKTKLYVVDGDTEADAVPFNKKRYEINTCEKNIESVFGVRLCSVISLPKPLIDPDRPYLPLGGNIEYRLGLIKTDPGLEGYHFEATFAKEKGKYGTFETRHVKLHFNAPGSSKDREYKLEYKRTPLDTGMSVLLDLKTPRRKLSVAGDVKDEGSKREANLVLKVDDSQEYAFHAKTGVRREGDKVILNPTWEISRPNEPKVVLTGTVIHSKSKSEIDVKDAPNSEKKPYHIKGYYELSDGSQDKRKKAAFELAVTTPDVEGKIVLKAEREHDHDDDDDSDEDHDDDDRKLEFLYESQRKGEEKRSLHIKLERATRFQPNNYLIHRHIEWQWSRFPQYNWRSTIHLEKDGSEYDNVVEARWGENFDDLTKRFRLEHELNIKQVSAEGALEGKGKLQLSYPRRSIEWDLKSQMNYVPGKKFHYDLQGKYAPNKEIKALIDYQDQSVDLPKRSLEIRVTVPTREILYSSVFEMKTVKEFSGSIIFQWQRAESIAFNYGAKSTGNEDLINIEAEATLKLSYQPKPFRTYKLHLYRDPIVKTKLTIQVTTSDNNYLVDFQIDKKQNIISLDLKLPSLEGKVTSRRVADGGEANFDFKTPNRRVVAVLQLKETTALKTYTLDLKWDVGRDESKKLNVKADVVSNRLNRADIKSVITLPNKKIDLNVFYDVPEVPFNGDHKINVFYKDETRLIDLEVEFDIDKSQPGRRTSHGSISLNRKYPGGAKVTYKTNLEHTAKDHKFDAVFNVETSYKQPYVIEIHHEHGPNQWSGSIQKVSTDGIRQKLALLLEADVGDRSGKILGFGLEVQSIKPSEGQNIDFAVVVREGYKVSLNEFAVVHENRVRLGTDREVGIALEIRGLNVESVERSAKFRFQVDTPFETLRSLKTIASLKSLYGESSSHVVEFEAGLGPQRNFKANLRVTRKENKSTLSLLLDSSRIEGDLEITATFEKKSDGFVVSIGGRHAIDRVLRLTADVQVGNPQSKIVLTLKTPVEKYETNRLSIFLEKGEQAIQLTVLAEWADVKSLKVSGQLKPDGNSGTFSGNLVINSEALELSGVTAEATGKLSGDSKYVVVKFNLGNERNVDIHWKRDQKANDGGFVGEFVVKINNEDFFSVKSDYVRKRGKLDELNVVFVHPMLQFGVGLYDNHEAGSTHSIKLYTIDGEKFFLLQAGRKDSKERQTLGPIETNKHLKFTVQRAPGDSRTIGISSSLRQVNTIVERNVKFAWNEEEKKFVGLSYKEETSSKGYDRRYQILLPSRTLEARSQKTSTPEGYSYKLELLLDAVREPDHKLSVNIEGRRTVVGAGVTRVARIVVRHPELKNDLVITNELRWLQYPILLSDKTEFELTGKKVTVDFEILNSDVSGSGFNYSATFRIRQEASKLDWKIVGHRAKGDKGRSVGLEMVWLNKENVPKTYTFFSSIDKKNQIISGVIRTPIRVFDWRGTYEKVDGPGYHGLEANIDYNYNNKLIRRESFSYSTRPSFNLKYYVNPADTNRVFRIHGGLSDDKTFHLSVVRVRDGQISEDVDFLIKLNTSRLILTKLKWKPGILQEIRAGIDSRSEGISTAIDEAVHNFADLAKDEVGDKTELIQNVFKNNIAPVAKSIRQRLGQIRNELKQDLAPGKLDRLTDVFEALFGSLVDTDDLSTKLQNLNQRIREGISAQIDRIFERLDNLVGRLETAGDTIVEYLASLPSRIKAYRTSLRERLPQIADKVIAFITKVQASLQEVLEEKKISKAIAQFREYRDGINNKIRDYLRSITGGLLDSDDDDDADLYESIKKKLYEYSELQGELPKVVKGILNAIRAIKQTIDEAIQNFHDNLRQVRDAALYSGFSLYEEYKTNPDLQALVEELRAYRQQLREEYLSKSDDDDDNKIAIFNSHHGKNLKERIRGVTDAILGHTRDRLEYLAGKDAVYDPKNGLLEYYILLSRPIKSLRDLPQGFASSRLFEDDHDHDDDDDDHDDDDDDLDLQKIVEDIKRKTHYADSQDHLPPYNGVATLIGNQHFKTFDGRFYDFAGKCSYILTQDFVDNNFTVILTYAEGQGGTPVKDSIVIGSDFHYITIQVPRQNKDTTVLLDGRNTDLPIQIENTVVSRTGSRIEVSNNKGFTLVYSDVDDTIFVKIDGFYFGKVGGLFGTFNNEPSDDFRTPEKQNEYNAADFVNSWEISDKCSSTSNLAVVGRSSSGSAAANLCYRLLKSKSSNVVSCHHEVDPNGFYNVCLEETAHIPQDVNVITPVVCKVVGAYTGVCKLHDIYLQSPFDCLLCHDWNGQMYGALQSFHLRDVPQSTDVIFIVEQKECNRPILVESFDEVAKELDRELQVEGLRDIRYGVVAFGGEGIHEGIRIHTARGQHFTDARSVAFTLKNMAFVGDQPSDVFGAIDVAARFPFRPGVSKIGLLFLCGECAEQSQSIEYSVLQQHLLDIGFTLHVLLPKEFRMRSKPQLASQIIGIDAQTAYKSKDMTQKELTGETELRSHFNGPKDLCQTLAQEMNGSVFRSDLLESRKNNIGKNVKGVFVRRVATTASPPRCQVCTCEAVPYRTPQLVCRHCNPPKPRILRDSKFINGVHFRSDDDGLKHNKAILEWVPVP